MGSLASKTERWAAAVRVVCDAEAGDDPSEVVEVWVSASEQERAALVRSDLTAGNTKMRWTALHEAASRGKLNLVHWLVTIADADVEALAWSHVTPLAAACTDGHLEVVRYLIDDAGAAVDTTDEDGWRPLHLAVRRNQIELCQMLLDRGAAFNVPVFHSKIAHPATPVNIAIHHDFRTLVEILEDVQEQTEDADADEEGRSKYRYQAPEHLRKKAPLTTPHVPKPVWVQWSNAFWLLSKKDTVEEFTHVWAVCPLADRNELVNHAVDTANTRALHRACEHNRLQTIKLLVDEFGADIQVQDKHGQTPLQLACKAGYVEVVEYLASNSDVNLKLLFSDGTAPIHVAANYSHLKLMQHLIVSRGVEVDSHDTDGSTALMYACSRGNLDQVKFLIESGASVEAKSADGETPLICAASNGHLECVRHLVQHCSANIRAVATNGDTAIMRASRRNHLPVVEFLCTLAELQKSVNICLLIACEAGALNVVKFLHEAKEASTHWQVRNGAPTYLQTTRSCRGIAIGSTPIDIAVQFELRAIADILVWEPPSVERMAALTAEREHSEASDHSASSPLVVGGAAAGAASEKI